MKMFHIDDFKCTLCHNWFCSPYNLPYLLPCTHSICTKCLKQLQASKSINIVCPQDLEQCTIHQINLNKSTKEALERLKKQHTNYNGNTQLQCITSLSLSFDKLLASKEKSLKNVEILIDQIFNNQIQRLKNINKKIKAEINRPFKVVDDWRQVVMTYLGKLRQKYSEKDLNYGTQLFHYIEEGRKIKLELGEYFNYDFDAIANSIMKNPMNCFNKNFVVFQQNFKIKQPKIEKIYDIGQQQHKKQQQRNQQKQLKIVQQPNKNTNYVEPQKLPQVYFENKINDTQISINKKKLTNQIKQNKVQNAYETNITKNKQKNRHQSQIIRVNSELRDNNNNGLKDLSNLPFQYASQSFNHKEKTMKIGSSAKQTFHDLFMASQDENISNSMYSEPKSVNSSIRKKNIQEKYHDKEMNLSHFQLQSHNEFENYCRDYEPRQTLKGNNRRRNKQIMDRHYDAESERGVSSQKKQPHPEQVSKIDQDSRSPYINKTFISNDLNNCTGRLFISPGIIREQYTQEGEHEDINNDNQQLLLGNDRMDISIPKFKPESNISLVPNGKQQVQKQQWHVSNQNFLKQWQIKRNNNQKQQLEIKQKGYYNCQRQKSTYTRKMQIMRSQEAFKLTTQKDNYIELINQSLHDIDMFLYLSQFDWHKIEIIKFVRTSITDQQLNVLLNFVVESKVKALVLSGNNLTDISLDAFLHFVEINKILKNVYLPKNNINILRSKPKINLLRQKGINIYI